MAHYQRPAGDLTVNRISRVQRLALTSIVLASLALAPLSAWGSPVDPKDDDCSASGSIASCLGKKNGTIDVTGEERRQGREGSPGHRVARQVSEVDVEAAAAAAFCLDAAANAAAASTAAAFTEIVPLCHGIAALPAVPPTQDQVASAFKELTLYRGAIRTDPRTSTLVNLETYFWCGDADARTCEVIGQGERTVILLGQPVRIRPHIVSYDWDFGDGAGQEITAGRATHTYAHATTADVTVTLTWTADYAVGAGAFQPIGDTTTTTSPVRALPVREAEAVIVSGG
jgi:PKD domain